MKIDKKKKVIKKIMDIWGSISAGPILQVSRKYNRQGEVTEQMLIGMCREMEKETPCYTSFTLRPKVPLIKDNFPKHLMNDSIAIVMQGPIIKENDFTLKTIEFYIKNPSIKYVIFSTWKSEDLSYIKKIKATSAIIVLSKVPEESGIGNLNYQLISMQAGIEKALEMDAEYICKTRSDQRIYNEFAFDFMYNLLKIFPTTASFQQKKRLIALATEYDSMMYPYFVSDFLYFGHRNEMKHFLEIPLENRKNKPPFTTRMERICNKSNAEIFIIKSYISSCNAQYGDSIQEYWRFLKEAMILIDKNIIGLYWNKYDNKYCEHKRNGTYFTSSKSKTTWNFDFNSWLSLYNGQIEYRKEYEDFLLNERE